MDRNTTLAFLLIGVVLFTWLYFNSPTPEPPQNKETAAAHQDTTKHDSVKAAQKVVKTENKPEEVSPFGAATQTEKILTVETELTRIEFTNKGGRIKRIFLKNFNTWYYANTKDTAFYKKNVQIVNTSKGGGDFNIVFVTKDGKLVNTSALDFNTDKKGAYYRVGEKDSVLIEYAFTTPDNKSIKKNFTIYGSNYASKVDIILENMQDVISSYKYDVVWQNGLNFVEENSVDEANYSSASAFAGEEHTVVDATTAGEKVTKDINGKIDWVAVRNKYFAMILAPLNPSGESGAYFEGTHTIKGEDVREFYSAGIKIPYKTTNYQKDSFTLYLGPIDYYLLKTYDRHFENVFEFGSFFGLKFIIRPISEYIMLPLLRFLDGFIPNYGLVIVLFTLIIKLALHPLSRSSMKSMSKMQKLQPKIAELKEKYKNDQQKQQQETMKLYQTYGINPMGGCLPMLLQMPILIALWSLFNVAIDIRQQPFIFWITNLSSPDVLFKLPFRLPLFNVDFVSGLALLMGITMFIQQKMSVKDPSQKALVYVMPVMFTVMFMSFPSGLNLYYFVFNLLSIAQQYYVTHKSGGEELVPVPVASKKKGFMGRMMEAAEKQAQIQKEASRKKRG